MQSSKGTLIITGAGQNLGQAIALESANRGYSLALVGRDRAKLLTTENLIRNSYSTGEQTISAHAFDLTNENETRDGFREIFAKHPKVSGLVNNAGTWLGRKEIRHLQKSDLALAFDLNFYSAFEATQAVIANHRTAHPTAALSISFMGATASLSGRKNVASFCLSKVAMRTFAQSLAKEVGPEGIHVSHFVIDGVLDNDRTTNLNPQNAKDEFMKQSEVAKNVLNIMEQDKSCWSFEVDLRPFKETW